MVQFVLTSFIENEINNSECSDRDIKIKQVNICRIQIIFKTTNRFAGLSTDKS